MWGKQRDQREEGVGQSGAERERVEEKGGEALREKGRSRKGQDKWRSVFTGSPMAGRLSRVARLVLRGSSNKAGRPARQTKAAAAVCRQARSDYRVHAEVVLLTYSSFAGLEQFRRFVSYVRSCLKKWSVKRWGATLEAYEAEGLHAHLVLQFSFKVDRTAASFAFEGKRPNVSRGDYNGEGLPGCLEKRPQCTRRLLVHRRWPDTAKGLDHTCCFRGALDFPWAVGCARVGGRGSSGIDDAG